ncbi:hypothetical protein ABPG77_006303 [Micractinium sp. CCAP 211/92]
MVGLAGLAISVLLAAGLGATAAQAPTDGGAKPAPEPAARSPGGAATEISSSIVLAVPTDYLLNGSGRSTCMDMVDRASQYRIKRLQFVPTLFWVDEGPLDPPTGFDPSCKTADFLASYYCYDRFNATRVKYFCYDRDKCTGPPGQADIARFRDSLKACMQLAVSRGHDLSVNMHVDDATKGGLGGWRNTLLFSPLQQFSGLSYVDVVLNPIADAIAGAVGPSTQVWLTMQGEMGATVFFYSKDWQQVAADMRTRIAGGGAGRQAGRAGTSQQGRVHIGLGINNAKLCGCILVPIVDQREYLARFPAAFEAVKGEFDLPAIQSLFNAIDYVGLSAYIPQSDIHFQPCDLEGLMSRLDQEFTFYGLTLKGLLAAGKEIHWSEFGVGGGTSPQGDQKAATAEEAAYTPFFGMSGAYTRAKDPFILYDLSQPSPVRDYARYFYNQTAAYLRQGGCDYRVAHVYIWNLPSWDVQVGGRCRRGNTDRQHQGMAWKPRGVAHVWSSRQAEALAALPQHILAGAVPAVHHQRGELP